MLRFFPVFFASACAVAQTGSNSSPLQYTAFLGDQAVISSIAVDSSGSAYIAGSTTAPLPVTAGAFDSNFAPPSCAASPCPIVFAGKLTATGAAFSYLTYLPISPTYQLPGSAGAAVARIAVDAEGDAWISGKTSSATVPVTAGAVQPQAESGKTNGFLLKMNPTGSAILYATYLGYAAGALTIDSSGAVYAAGTSSKSFPINADYAGDGCFIAKFSASAQLVYATTVGDDPESAVVPNAIAVDSSGAAYVAGTVIMEGLPATPGAFQTGEKSPVSPAFALKLDPTGSTLIYATYLSGDNGQTVTGIAVDNAGEAIVAGSDSIYGSGIEYSPFPTTTGALQTSIPAGLGTAPFVLKLNAAGSTLIFSTFFSSGSGNTSGSGVAVDASGNVFVAGGSSALDLPTTPGAIQQCASNGTPQLSRGFVAGFGASGSSLVYSSYLGVGGTTALAIDPAGNLYLAGSLTDFPVVPGSFGWIGSGASIVKLAPVALPAGSVNCIANDASRVADWIAPGEIADILGIGIGPAQPVSASVVNGAIPGALGGIEVLFNGSPAPILSAGPNQIRVIVPFAEFPPALTDSNFATVQVIGGVRPAQPIFETVLATLPAIYTVNGSSFGQALIVNQDGSLNSEANPAPIGSIATMYATGLNQTEPPLADGAVATAAAPLSLFPITLTTTAIPDLSISFPITYAGAAPGMAAGLTQINFQIPDYAPNGFVPIALSAGTFTSPAGVYLYTR